MPTLAFHSNQQRYICMQRHMKQLFDSYIATGTGTRREEEEQVCERVSVSHSPLFPVRSYEPRASDLARRIQGCYVNQLQPEGLSE